MTAMPDSFHPLQPQWDVLLAGVQADLLDAALELRLFDVLDEPATAADLAQRTGLDATRLGAALELLADMGLVERRTCSDAGGTLRCYRNTTIADRYLRHASATSCVEAWRFRLRAMRNFGKKLPELLRPGAGEDESGNGKLWAAAARKQIDQEQRAVTVEAAMALLDTLPELDTVCRFADFGGGPGRVAIALAQRWPQACGEVVDLPELAEVARGYIAEAGLARRIGVRAGPLSAGAPYDFVWCSSVLHFVDDPRAALADIHAALTPGGVLVSAHAELPDGTAARRTRSYYLPLQLRGRHVARANELSDWLREAGFETICEWEAAAFPVAPLRIRVARRARA